MEAHQNTPLESKPAPAVPSAASQPARVLVVDDEDMVRMVVSAVLAQRGYAVSEARDGADALRQCASGVFDVAVVDLLMPRMNGLETLRSLRQLQPQMRGLLLSGVADIEEMASWDSAADLAFLQKPFDNVELLSMVERLVSQPRQSS